MTSISATEGAAGAASSADSVEKARRAAAAKLKAAAFGEIVEILARDPAYRRYSLADVGWLAKAAVVNRQFSLVQLQAADGATTPSTALVMWASVSDAIHARILTEPGQPLKLTPAERNSGEHIWITDAVGDRRIVTAAIEKLRETTFKGRRLNTISRSSDGAIRVVQM